MSTDVVIDLGLTSDTAPPPSRYQPRRPSPRLLIVLGALLTLLVPASVPPARAPLERLYAIAVATNAEYLIDHGSLYLITSDAVSAYRLRDGRLRWRTPVPRPVYGLFPDEVSHTLISVADASSSATVQVFDQETGAVLWQRAEVAGQIFPGDGRLVLAEAARGEPYRSQALSAVDARTGEVLWRHTTPAGTPRLLAVDATAGRGTGLVVVYDETDPAHTTGSALAERLDPATGSLVSRASLRDLIPALTQANDWQVSSPAHGLLVVTARTGEGAWAYALDAERLTLRWTSVLPAYAAYAADCVGSICLYDESGMVLLDPATGQSRGTTDAWRYAVPLPSGRLLAQADTMAVVDEGLRPVLALDSWQVDAVVPVTLLQRPGTDRRDTWIGVLGSRPDRIRLLGALHVGTVDWCDTDGVYLVCRATGSGMVVFRLP